jgi:hypothetical protein
MREYLFPVLFALCAFATNANAAPGDLPPHVPMAPGQDIPGGASVVLTSAARGPAGAITFDAGFGTTLSASARLASVADGAGLLDVPRFSRTRRPTPVAGPLAVEPAWVLDAVARLRPSTHVGKAQVLLFDLSDNPRAIEDHKATAIFPIVLPSASAVETQLALSTNDGFTAGHVYGVQIVQLQAGWYRVIAQGNIALE